MTPKRSNIGVDVAHPASELTICLIDFVIEFFRFRLVPLIVLHIRSGTDDDP